MAQYHLNLADENLIDAIVDQKELEHRVPYFTDYINAVQDTKSMMNEASTIGRYTHRTGFTGDRTMQRFASFPLCVVVAIKEIDPEFFKDPVKVGKFLKRHPEYATTTIIK